MSEPIETPVNQEPTPGSGGEVTFTQAQVDALVAREKAKAEAKAKKGMPSAEELAAFRAWQADHQSDEDKLGSAIKERDEARAKVEQYERERVLLSKGVPAEDIDYYAYKIGKTLTEGKDFKTAAEEYLAAHPINTVKVDTGAALGSGPVSKTTNEQMNTVIRSAFK